MDKKITSLAEENKLEELIQCLSEVDNKELCSMIERKVLKGRNDTFTLVRAILLGSPPESSACIERRCEVYKQCISALQKNDLNNKMASELVGLLMLETDMLPGPALADLASIYIDGIKSDTVLSAKSLELLPKILSAIAGQENIVYGGNHMTGVQYKGQLLNTICSCRWDQGSVINLTTMFRDVPLTSDELKFVIEKVLRMLRELELADIPALVYQLLLLCIKGHKKLVLEGIISFFSEHDKKQKPADEQELSEDLLDDCSTNAETLRLTEGTVIFHINFAVKGYQELGREFIKCLKGYQNCSIAKTLSPFSLAMALSLARINRFEDQIFDFLKSSIMKSYKDLEKQSRSHWIQEIVPDMDSVEEFILQTVQNSTYGWDHVVQGLVQLGFLLMDSFGPKAVFGRTDLVPSIHHGPSHQCCQLGANILLKTFKAHEMVRSEILEQIFNRVIIKATSPVSHFLELLGDIVLASPSMLLDCTSKIREMFDYLSMLSPTSAEGLLRAIHPLLKLSMSLKDSLIIVLRKAMFSRQAESRKIGAGGFLMILKHFRVLGGIRSSQCSQPSFSGSQIEVEMHVSHNASSNEAMCLEILGNLRRCLAQQADVRLLLYQGLFDVLDRNTQLLEPILSMLMCQLKTYYEKNTDINPPLKLEPCIIGQGDQVYLAEPLAHLLGCIQLCMVKATSIQSHDDGTEDCEVKTQLHAMMASLIQRMITSEMEDFELDKSADYSLVNSVGVRNNIFAILILGTYEALMEYIVMSESLSESTVRQLLQLFENYRKLSDILREKSSAAAGKKGKTAAKAPQSLLSLKMVTQILHVMISDDDRHLEELKETLCMNTDFLKYLLTVSHQRLSQIQDKGHCDGAEGKCKPKIFQYSCKLARLLLGYYVQNQQQTGNQRVRDRHIMTLTLECLLCTVTIATQQHARELDTFLESLDIQGSNKANHTTLDETLYFSIKYLQRLVMNIFSCDEENQCMKDVGLLLNIIFQLAKALTAQFTDSEHILTWLDKLCREQNIDDLTLVKSMLTSLLSMCQLWKGSLTVLRDLAQDVHCQLGDIDQEVEMDGQTNFATVTHRAAAPTIFNMIIHQCEQELDDTDWVITRVKADRLAMQAEHTGGECSQLTQQEGDEKSICTRLGNLVNCFHELVQTALPVGPCNEQLLKILTRVYTTLTSLVKYYLSLYGTVGRQCGRVSARFEKLVKLSGTNLTQHCYALISYIQLSETEKMQHAGPDKGKKKKAADKKKDTAAQPGKSNVLKQTRTIPNLIFAIEQYERYLIQLTKKSKVNLMEHMKHSTSRDFRINPSFLAEGADESSDDAASSSSDNDGDGQNDVSAVERSVAEASGESDQENDPAASNIPSRDDTGPVKKKAKLGTARKKTSKT